MVWNNLPLFHEFLIYLSLFNDATAQDALQIYYGQIIKVA